MGQALSSCTRCCSGYDDEGVESDKKAISNEKDPQWKEKIRAKSYKIALDMDPKSAEKYLYFTEDLIDELEKLRAEVDQ